MDVMHERVAGLDVHKETIVACVRIMAGRKAYRECRTFDTTTSSLRDLLTWLTESGCTHVAMEATGVYWKPVWNILSDGPFELMLANAAHIKNVPGRKTDMNDAMWIADLLSCGLIRASFVPEQEIQELRSLLRARKQLTREQTSHLQRIQKTLEEANIKLDSVITEIMGVSGRRMIEAMINGVRNPFKLAELADRRIRASRKQFYDALHGRLTDHHRFMLRLYLRQYDALEDAINEIDEQVDAAIAKMDAEVAAGQAPFRSLIALLCTIPGIAELAAKTILAEIGTDMSRFPTAGHLLAWAGPVSGAERKCRQTQVIAPAQRIPLAQDADGAVRLGGRSQEGQLLQGAVQPPARTRDCGRLTAAGTKKQSSRLPRVPGRTVPLSPAPVAGAPRSQSWTSQPHHWRCHPCRTERREPRGWGCEPSRAAIPPTGSAGARSSCGVYHHNAGSCRAW
jgi:transposase